MHFLGVEQHALILILVDTHSGLEGHLNISILVLLSDVVNCEINVLALQLLRLAMVNFLELGFLVIVNSEDWVAFSSLVFGIHTFDGHHACSASPYICLILRL